MYLDVFGFFYPKINEWKSYCIPFSLTILHPIHWMCQVFETVKECATHTHTWAHTHTNKFQQSRGHKSCPMSVTENLNSQAHCTHVPSVVLCNFPFITPFSRNKNREADRATGKWDWEKEIMEKCEEDGLLTCRTMVHGVEF